MEALEVGHFWGVACFDEGFEACEDKGCATAAEDGLFAEEVGFGFFAEGCFYDAGSGATDAFCPGEGDFFCIAAWVLVDGDECRDAFIFEELATDDVAGSFGGDHDNVDVFGRDDGLKVDSEAVAEDQGFAFGEVGFDIFFENFWLPGVRDSDEDDIGLLGGFCGIEDCKVVILGGFSAFA